MLTYILIALGVVICALSVVMRRRAKAKQLAAPTKKSKRNVLLWTIAVCIGAYLAITRTYGLLFPPTPHEGFEFGVELWAERTELNILGFNISETVLNTWYVMAALVILALVVRFVCLRKLTDNPRGMQNALEAAVEKILDYMNSTVHGLGEAMGSYIFTIGLLLVGCAVLEMFGMRTPASDIMFTLAIGIITFLLINVFGFIKKGAAGRMRSFIEPVPFLAPIKLVTDIAIPVSLAARLFGNMLGGMIIMDLIYTALGTNAVGIPSVLGLFFNVFHPLLQAFIFVTLSLSFIREAVE
ncbi:MAG: F0F1 ATP synthase subunit A [Oscillospiraceae bacterium]|jgi:F-type H+-transporting ATPase subunit a|nr:F0F1 ATP synthase subunit A [Oscillospiraceae bacterium]